jgi:hypothetical protein
MRSTRDMKKIVLIEKEGKETQVFQFVNRVAIKTGDSEEYRGFDNTAPTYFRRVNAIDKLFIDRVIYFGGNIFKEHKCSHKEIRVFCNTYEEYGEGVSETPAVVKFLDANFIKVYEE